MMSPFSISRLISLTHFFAAGGIAIGMLTAANAQTPAAGVTLQASLSEAETNSPDLKRLKAAAEKASWSKLEALSGHLPRLSVGYDHFLNSNYLKQSLYFGGNAVTIPGAYPQDNFTIDASWTIFDGFGTYHAYKAAGYNTEAAELDLSRARFQLEETVRSAFFQALAAQKLYEVAQQNVKTLEDHLSKVQLTERNGFGTKFDVLRVEATLEEARADQEAAENNMQIARDTLTEVMGIEGRDARSLAGDLPVLKETDVPKDLSLTATDRDDFKAETKRDQAVREMVAASHGVWYPSITLFAEQEYYKFGSFDPAIIPNSDYQSASMVGLRLKWNLFDGGLSFARQKEAAQAAVEAEAGIHRKLTKLPSEFDTWKRKFFYNASLYRARSRVLDQYQESVRLAAVGVKAGSRTHTEMLDAELDLFRARGNLVRAQADAVDALGQLELAVGHKLWDPTASPR